VFTAKSTNSLVAVYCRGPFDFGFRNFAHGNDLNLKATVEGQIVQGYMRNNIDSKAKVLYMTYNSFDNFPWYYKEFKLHIHKAKITQLNNSIYKLKNEADIPKDEFSLLRAAQHSTKKSNLVKHLAKDIVNISQKI